MLRFFRVNDPYRLVFIFIIIAVIRVTYGLIGMPISWPELKHLLLGEWLASGFVMYAEAFDYTAPLSAWTYQGVDFLFGRSRVAHWVVSGIVLFIQAALFNQTLLKNKVLSEPNYVPAFLYVIFSVALFDFFALSPQLMSLTWVIISVDHLIRRMDNEAKDELFLFPGFYLGIAGLFYFPATAFFLVFLLAMIVIVRAKLRRILLYVYGWTSAYLIVGVVLYINGSLMEFSSVYFAEIFRDKMYFIARSKLLLWMALPSLFLILSLLSALGRREGSLHAKTQQFMLLLFIAAFGELLLSGTLSGADLVFFLPVFTFFLTNYFIKIRRRFWRFLIPTLMILSSVAAPLIGLKTEFITEDLLVPEPENKFSSDTKLMVIGPLSPEYLTCEIAGPFLDEQIGQGRLEDLDYYHESRVFQKIITKAQPNVVIDGWKAMQKIQYRFPEIERMEIDILAPSN